MTHICLPTIKDFILMVLDYTYVYINNIPATTKDLVSFFDNLSKGRECLLDWKGWAKNSDKFAIFIST